MLGKVTGKDLIRLPPSCSSPGEVGTKRKQEPGRSVEPGNPRGDGSGEGGLSGWAPLVPSSGPPGRSLKMRDNPCLSLVP